MISLSRLIAENFLGVTYLDFEFSNNGLYLILGENGAGKSVRFEALLWVIYGKVFRDNLTNKEIIHEESETGCYVSLDFDYNGKTYFVRRSLEHPEYGSDLIVLENNQPITRKGITETETFLELIFGEYNIFISTILFPQQFKETFLGSTDSKQKKLFEQILDLQHLRDLGKKAGTVFEDFAKSIETKNADLSYLIQSFMTTSGIYERQINEQKAKILTVEHTIANLKHELEHSISLQDIEKEIRKIEGQFNNINIDLSDWSRKESDLVKKFKDLETEWKRKKDHIGQKTQNRISMLTQSFESKRKGLEADLTTKFYKSKEVIDKDFGVANKSIDDKITDLKNQIANLDSDMQRTILDSNEKIGSFRLERKQFDMDFHLISCNIKDKEQEISDIVTTLSELHGECPLCKRAMDDTARTALVSKRQILDSLVEEERKKYSKLADESNNLLRNIDAEQDKVEKVKIRYNENVTNTRIELSGENHKLEKHNESHKNSLTVLSRMLEDEFKQLIEDSQKSHSKEILRLKARMDKVNLIFNSRIDNAKKEHLISIQEIKDKIQNLESDKLKIQGKLADSQHSRDYIKSLKTRIEENQNTLETEKQKLETDIETKKNNETDTNRQMEELRKEIDLMTQNIIYYKFWVEAFGNQGIENFIIGKSIPYLNQQIQKYLSIITDKFTVELTNTSKTQKGEDRNKLTAKVMRSNGKATKFGKLSGGEKRLIDLAVMFALRDLAETQRNIVSNVLFFDEVFDSLSDNNGESVILLLKILSQNKSCYLITHNSWWKNQDFDEVIEL